MNVDNQRSVTHRCMEVHVLERTCADGKSSRAVAREQRSYRMTRTGESARAGAGDEASFLEAPTASDLFAPF